MSGSITFKNSGGTELKNVEYAYDVFKRLIRRKYDANGPGSGAATNIYLVGYDGINPTLGFDGTAQADVSNRFLWGPQVDQLYADKQVTNPTSAGNTLWSLGDQVGTLRDIADYKGTAYTITNHRTYDSFGNLTAESQSSVDEIFAYTGKFFDDVTKLSNHLNRWFDPGLGKWVSEDPIGFFGGDVNLARYVGNLAANATDSQGLDIAVGGGNAGSGVQGEIVTPIPGEQIMAIGVLVDEALKHAKTWVPSASSGDPQDETSESTGIPKWGINSIIWGPRTATGTTILGGLEAQAVLMVGPTVSTQTGISVIGDSLIGQLLLSRIGIIGTFGWQFGIPFEPAQAQAGLLLTVSNANKIEDLAGESGTLWGAIGDALGVDVSAGNLQEVFPGLPMPINNALGTTPTTMNVGVGVATPGISGGTAHVTSVADSMSVLEIIRRVLNDLPMLPWPKSPW